MSDYKINVTDGIAKMAVKNGFVSVDGNPTAEQISGWLREKKGIDVCVHRGEVLAFGSYHVTSRYKTQIILDNVEGYRKHSGLGVLETFCSYEQAILKGICIALNLLNNN